MGNLEFDNERLWSRGIKGDGGAFRVLYIRYRDRIFRHAYRLSGDRQDAEDIMATAFLELWRRRAKLRVVEGFVLPWLLVTTTNTARKSGRAALRYGRLLDSLPRRSETSDPMGDDVFHGHRDALDKDLARALGALNSTDLHLVSLVVFEEFTIAAAAILGLTPGSAKTRMHRARKRMKVAIPGTHPIPTPTTVLEGARS
ncbi:MULTISPECIES: sigma-70 family RNA polymerase sigma factor [unclassified Arthrobacter]|uniref:RNA polymerase sigma factor n=1 Tax=unclassified Arthrobacter TaxID=235627 RepID=UPI001CFFD66B|nr:MULTISPECIES: sigma-70 family RNA polymerase sigma factor [unclassified Arthrobacter]MCB5281403.1 ECF RNA polymerase sigma factor SigE [Arthrobacter sp. ES1]WGZ80104.1 sigma-70 family RNA polymerase sigma factor [Arthrobacter sp. EM1]